MLRISLLALMLLMPLGLVPSASAQAATSSTIDLSTLSELDLYEQMEASRLAHQFDQERAACDAMLARFPQGQFAPKAKYLLVLLGLQSPLNFDAAIEKLHEINRDYPGSPFAVYAEQIHHALTDPKTALDIQILVEQYRSTARVHYDESLLATMVNTDLTTGLQSQVQNSLMNVFAEHHPLSEAMVILRVCSFYDERPILDWLRDDRTITVSDRATLAADIAEMMYRSPLRDRWGDSRKTCQYVLDNFTSAGAGCAQALRLLGELDMRQNGDLDAAEANFRKLAEKFDGAEAFCALAHRHFLNGNYQKAKDLLNEARFRWPQSRWSLEAYKILSRREMSEKFGSPGEMTSAESKWAELASGQAAPDTSTSSENPSDTQTAAAEEEGGSSNSTATSTTLSDSSSSFPSDQSSYTDCGPYAFYLSCQRLEVPCSLQEAYDRCQPRINGTSSFFDLYHAFLEKGLEVQALEMGLDELRSLGADSSAAVVLHQPNHFKVLQGMNGEQFTLEDQGGAALSSADQLGLFWDGYVLVVRKSAASSEEALKFDGTSGAAYFSQLADDFRSSGRTVEEYVLSADELRQKASSATSGTLFVLNLPAHFPVLKSIGGAWATGGNAGSSSTLAIEHLGQFQEGPALVVSHAPDEAEKGTQQVDRKTSGSKVAFVNQLNEVLTSSTNIRGEALEDLAGTGNAGLILHNTSRVIRLESITDTGVVLSDGTHRFTLTIERLRVLWDGRVLVVAPVATQP